ncbi:polysaccharide deacetylase family protein [Nitrogeniibacter mangrovi]|uniref:Polysaccharide deacetylase family protein n=1 Tax=Nitrogeniibacter mangrovi TaxID=2016596 RepID=A0A6C1B668_9RHOO|nr:polysaccharide deacetylase family protein [Nitrogeniibacter mangrovi]QID18539.1 polysaccharide deacetylase family protein [Nitrogeniibacter mangrovi]
MFKHLFSRLSPNGPNGRVSIFIFHRVLGQKDLNRYLVPSVDEFDRMLGWIGAWFDVIPLSSAMRMLGEGRLPRRAACITFDDGYADNYLNALPVLEKHGMHATFFVTSGYLDGGIMWNDVVSHSIFDTALESIDLSDVGLGSCALATRADRIGVVGKINKAAKYMAYDARAEYVSNLATRCGVSLPSSLMMSSDQLRKLAEVMEIGAHTVTHPILAKLSSEQALSEIRDGKVALERVLGKPVDLFAYPNGRPGKDYLDEHVQMAREIGFFGAVSTTPGVASIESDLFQLPRFTPWATGKLKFGAQLAQNMLRSSE